MCCLSVCYNYTKLLMLHLHALRGCHCVCRLSGLCNRGVADCFLCIFCSVRCPAGLTFEVVSLERVVQGSNLPLPKTLIKSLLNMVMPSVRCWLWGRGR